MNILNIVSMVCFALCLVMFFYLKWHIKQRTSASGMLEEYRTEVVKLIAEIDKATDRDSQLVEDRINQLKILLEDTDKRIAVYVKELEKSRTGEALYTSLGRGIRAALSTAELPSTVPVPEASLPVQREHPLNSPHLFLELPVQSPPPQPAVSANLTAREWPGKPPSRKQIRAHIDLLLNEGLPAQEIASRLEISVAEVNLAMNLRRTKS